MEENEIIREIQSIVEQIIQKYRPLKIILFGFAARGEYDKLIKGSLLREYSVDVLTVGDTLANDKAIPLVHGNSDSVTPDSNLILVGITNHALKVSKGKGIHAQ